jgi:GR25 family glycosyltransferase involved in LPS biosynthesis
MLSRPNLVKCEIGFRWNCEVSDYECCEIIAQMRIFPQIRTKGAQALAILMHLAPPLAIKLNHATHAPITTQISLLTNFTGRTTRYGDQRRTQKSARCCQRKCVKCVVALALCCFCVRCFTYILNSSACFTIIITDDYRSSKLSGLHLLSRHVCVHLVPPVLQNSGEVANIIRSRLQPHITSAEPSVRLLKLGLSGRLNLSAFSVACTLAHRKVWRAVVERKVDYALVLEHDAIYVHSRIDKAIRDATKVAATVKRHSASWEFVNLGRCWDFCDVDIPIAGVIDSRQQLVRSVNALCTHAYLVSYSGARKLLRFSKYQFLPVDALLTLLYRSGKLDMYSATPVYWVQNRTRSLSVHSKTLRECDRSLRSRYFQSRAELRAVSDCILCAPSCASSRCGHRYVTDLETNLLNRNENH